MLIKHIVRVTRRDEYVNADGMRRSTYRTVGTLECKTKAECEMLTDVLCEHFNRQPYNHLVSGGITFPVDKGSAFLSYATVDELLENITSPAEQHVRVHPTAK